MNIYSDGRVQVRSQNSDLYSSMPDESNTEVGDHYGVYKKQADETWRWVADFADSGVAVKFAEAIESAGPG